MAPFISRRRFLWGAGGTTVLSSQFARALALPTSLAAAPPANRTDRDRCEQLFDDPPLECRPMTRWWWFGGAVTPAEITRELTFMRDAGIGGAEIQPVYPVAIDDPKRGIRHLRYHTPEWFEVLGHAAREARRLGLQLDFTLGSGWPYGGPFIPTSLAARRLRVLSRDAVGPSSLSWHLSPHLTGDDRIVAVVAAPVGKDQQIDVTGSQVLADQPRQETAGSVRDDRWVRDWTVPEGEWRIFVLLDSPTGQLVKRPTLGMEGNVLDHFNAEAMQVFLRAAGDRVMEALAPAGRPPFRSVFCDSLEVYGADWTRDLLQEFQARRGYDLAPYLPALWQDAGPETPHVRYDYHQTLSDLMLENFFQPLAEWSERRGMTARVQAHGAMGDVMRAYGLSHVPEGENIFLGDRYMVNLRHRRLVSSAAHVYGKPLASAETYTWLRTPLYMTTLEMMKAATDSTFLDGVNHIVNHGYSYSPPEAGEPGWAFYASTEANHTNTWWRHYPHLARYVRRAQALLQTGVAVNPVAVYLPLGEVYSKYGAGGLHVDVESERQIGSEMLAGLRLAGYDFDLLHDHALDTLARLERGQLVVGNGAYSVLIVPPTRFIPAPSASRIAELARRGGHVIFIERVPEGAPGLTNQKERSASVLRSLDGLWRGRRPSIGDAARTGIGSVALVADHTAALARLASLMPPDFRILETGNDGAGPRASAVENVGFLHRRSGAVDYYLVANVSADEHDLRVEFGAGHRVPERWDIETGSKSSVAYDYVSAGGLPGRTEVQLHLDPYESCFVAFGSGVELPIVTRTTLPILERISRRAGASEVTARVSSNGEYALTLGSKQSRRVSVADVPQSVAIDGPWVLRLGAGPALTVDRLRSWTDIPEGASFSGWGRYETEFAIGTLGDDVEWMIDLGRVHETAEVTLNGEAVGVAWKSPRRLRCGPSLRAGRNQLRVDVANLWIHHMVAQPPPIEWKTLEETVGIRWGRYGETKPEALPPAGLLGPVRLVPWKRVRVKI